MGCLKILLKNGESYTFNSIVLLTNICDNSPYLHFKSIDDTEVEGTSFLLSNIAHWEISFVK